MVPTEMFEFLRELMTLAHHTVWVKQALPFALEYDKIQFSHLQGYQLSDHLIENHKHLNRFLSLRALVSSSDRAVTSSNLTN